MVGIATLVMLHELMNSDDEKLHKGKARKWVKRRRKRGYSNNIIRELRIENQAGFRAMFRIDVTNFHFILAQVSDLISPQEILVGPIQFFKTSDYKSSCF